MLRTWHEKTKKKNLDANKSHIPKSLCKRCQELQLQLMLIIKPLMPHGAMKFVQWKQKQKKLRKRSGIHLLDTVQRHHTISVSSKRCWNGSEHQAVGLSCVTDLCPYIIICCLIRGHRGKEGSSTMKNYTTPLIALPLPTSWPHYIFKIPCSPLSSEASFDMQ